MSRRSNSVPEVTELTIRATLEWFRNNRERWLKASDFKLVFGIDARQARIVVNRLRHRGHPIVSGNLGYCYTFNVSLIQDCASRLRSQIRETQLALDALLKAAINIPTQQAGTRNGKLITIRSVRRNSDKGQR